MSIKNLNLYIILGQGIYYGVANECIIDERNGTQQF